MMNKLANTKTLTIKLAIALALVSNVTLADSPREWGYWDATTAAGPGDVGNGGFSNMTNSQSININNNNNPGNNLNNEQNATRLGRAVNVPQEGVATAADNYIGYTFCLYGCGVGNESIGKFDLTIDQAKQPTYVSSNKRNTQQTAYYDSAFDVEGVYNGIPFTMNNQYAEIKETTKTKRSGKVMHQRDISTYGYGYLFSMNLNNQVDGVDKRPFNKGFIMFDKSISTAVLGTPIDARSIASQLRLGQIYHFRGSSFLGSKVNIAVDFQNANWKGRWSKIGKVHNGFRASGAIDGSSLISSKVKGLGKRTSIGFVESGKVDATLVGVINGKDASKAGVIGSTVIDVKQRRGVKSIGDVFTAKAVVK